jgi:hypothetical protein
MQHVAVLDAAPQLATRYDSAMTQTGIAQRLAGRIRWFGSPDPTWTEEAGRPTTAWAVSQALALLEGMERAGLLHRTEPQVTATARGGIEFVWEAIGGREVDVTVPADPGEPFEIAWIRRQPDVSVAEDERAVWAVDDAIALVAGPDA